MARHLVGAGASCIHNSPTVLLEISSWLHQANRLACTANIGTAPHQHHKKLAPIYLRKMEVPDCIVRSTREPLPLADSSCCCRTQRIARRDSAHIVLRGDLHPHSWDRCSALSTRLQYCGSKPTGHRAGVHATLDNDPRRAVLPYWHWSGRPRLRTGRGIEAENGGTPCCHPVSVPVSMPLRRQQPLRTPFGADKHCESSRCTRHGSAQYHAPRPDTTVYQRRYTRTRALRSCCTRRGLPAEFGSPHRAPTTKKESAAGTHTVTSRCARNTAVCTHVGNKVLQPNAAVAAGRLLHKRIWTAKHRRVECHAFDGVPLAKPRRVLAIVCDVHPAPNTDTQISATKQQ